MAESEITKLDITESEYKEAFRLASRHQWLQRSDEFALGLQSLLLECREADCPWLLGAMLEKFKVLTSADLNEITILIADQIQSEYKATKTLVTAVSDNHKPDGSEVIINSLKGKLGVDWSGSLSNTFANALLEKYKHIQTYILVDDFIGTGNKICGFIKALKDHLILDGVKDFNIAVAAFASMESGEKLIATRYPEVPIFSGYTLKRGISDQMQGEIRSRVRDAMINMESTIIASSSKWTPGVVPTRSDSYNFGYNQSEALIWIEGFNIPNNVFPFFWLDKKISSQGSKRLPRRTLFARR